MSDLVYFDLETQRSADEVGGWKYASRMKVSVAVIYSTAEGAFSVYEEPAAPELARRLAAADLVVGFNVLGFDYKVLQPYADFDLGAVPTFDMLADLHAVLGHRVSLDSCVQATLGVSKSADGLAALRWWKEGQIDLIKDYCQQDVRVTRDLHEYGCREGRIRFNDRYRGRREVAVDWASSLP